MGLVRDRPYAMRYITRVDTEKNHCFFVRFQRTTRTGRRFNAAVKSFSDGVLGGKAAALAAAQKWRDETERELAPPQSREVPPGHGYVRRCTWQGRPAFEGWMKLEGKRRSVRTKWLIDVWGPRVAKRRCQEWLALKQAELSARAKQRARPGPKRAAAGRARRPGARART